MKKILSILFLLFLTVNIFAQDNQDSAKEEYFEKHYRKTWDSLSEFEQYAIAFSSNLFQINKFYHLDFSAKSFSDESKENIKEILEDSWGITDYDSLMENFDNLLTGGHSGAYKSLAALTENEFIDFIEPCASVGNEVGIIKLSDKILFIKIIFIPELADDFLEKVFDGNDAGCGTVLIENYCN